MGIQESINKTIGVASQAVALQQGIKTAKAVEAKTKAEAEARSQAEAEKAKAKEAKEKEKSEAKSKAESEKSLAKIQGAEALSAEKSAKEAIAYEEAKGKWSKARGEFAQAQDRYVKAQTDVAKLVGGGAGASEIAKARQMADRAYEHLVAKKSTLKISAEFKNRVKRENATLAELRMSNIQQMKDEHARKYGGQK